MIKLSAGGVRDLSYRRMLLQRRWLRRCRLTAIPYRPTRPPRRWLVPLPSTAAAGIRDLISVRMQRMELCTPKDRLGAAACADSRQPQRTFSTSNITQPLATCFSFLFSLDSFALALVRSSLLFSFSFSFFFKCFNLFNFLVPLTVNFVSVA